jgi:O-antigen/teichoic acid export membrane protein
MTASVRRAVQNYQSNLVLRSSLWYIVGSFFQKGVSFISVLIFSRLLLPDQFGTVSIYLIWVSIFSVLLTLYVEASVARTKFDLEWEDFKRFVSSVTFLGIITGCVFLLVLVLMPADWIKAIFSLQKPFILLAAVTGILLASFRVMIAIWQTTYNYKANLSVTFAVDIIIIAVSILLMILPVDNPNYDAMVGRIAGYSIVTALVGLYFLQYHLRSGKTFINRHYWWLAVSYAVPVIPHTLASSLLANSDRILINQYIGRTEAGIYAFAYQLGSIVLLLWGATNTAWSPWYFEKMKEANYTLIRLRTRQYLGGFTAVTAVFIILSPFLVTMVTSEAYADAKRIVPIIMASSFLSLLYGFYANIEFYERKTVYISIATIGSAAINIGLNLLLLPRFSYLVAAWTTLIAYLCLFAFHFAVVRIKMRELDTNSLSLNLLAGVGIILLASIVYLLT